MGYSMDISSAGAVQRSMDAIRDPESHRLIEVLLRKANKSARYFCAGMLDIAKYSHYALNVPLYTHFTSPIRRYADILVHRQMESVAQGPSTEPKFTMDRDSVAKIAQQCNMSVFPAVTETLLTSCAARGTLLSLRRSNRLICSCVYLSPT